MRSLLSIIKLGKSYAGWMVLAALMGFLTVGSGIGLMMTSAYIIAKAAVQTPISELQVAITGVRFFGIVRGIFRYLDRYISHEVTFKLLARLRGWFFEKLERIVPSRDRDFSSGDLLARAVNDIDSLEHVFVRVISPPFVFVAVLVLTSGLLGIFNLKYSIIFSLIFVSSGLILPVVTFLISDKPGRKIVQLRSNLNELSVDIVQGLSELEVFGRQILWKQKFMTMQDDLLGLEHKMNIIQAAHENLTGLVMNFTIWFLLQYAIPDVTSGSLKGVYLSVITIGIMAAFEIAAQIPPALQYLGKSIESGNRLLEITTGHEASISGGINRTAEPVGYELLFKNVSFSYGDSPFKLQHLTLRVKENEMVGIVGPSGAGKSTLVNLLSKLWECESGTISLGGADYRYLDDSVVRSVISVVPQKIHLFTGTIRENLQIAKWDATEEELYKAVRSAGLEGFVKSLPRGFETQIGELGRTLSGGEQKRLGIARALLRDSRIVVFDEVTSHLDRFSEMNILDTIKLLHGSKTIIFVTHRFTRMKMFDRIYVLSNGKLAEEGSHDELIGNKGIYFQLFNSQQHMLG
ncbi:MAG: thiol reductant ABC exporter subunit CydC [Candidatus Kryptoniota bacterium]